MFTLRTSIHQYDTFAQFVNSFNLGGKDLVITQSFTYNQFIEGLRLPCNFIIQDKYGAGEPSDEMIQRIMDDNASCEFDRVIAIGGGTVIDISKLFTLGILENVTAAFERTIPIVKQKQLVIIPTTCGTGSEVTNISIAELKQKHTKLGLADDAILADDAVLIPELLRSLPFKPYAFSSIDALVHATESFLSPKATPYSKLFSVEAIKIIVPIFKHIKEEGEDYRFKALEPILRASNYAGIAFGNAGCAAVHALSYPLGAVYHVAHGESNYQFFTKILSLYAERKPNGSIEELNQLFAELLGVENNPKTVYAEIDTLLSSMVKKRHLKEYGMQEEECDQFADNVMVSQQRLLKNNYVELSRDEIAEVYKSLF